MEGKACTVRSPLVEVGYVQKEWDATSAEELRAQLPGRGAIAGAALH